MSYPTILPIIGHQLAEELDEALAKAIAKHAPMNSAHEGWAVIYEETDELWEEVRAWQPTDHRIPQMRKEAIHVAAMALRFIKDVCDRDSGAGEKEWAMRYFFDTEFIEDGKTIDLISIGIVAGDGRTYYAESLECDLGRANEWVKENVLPHLSGDKTPRVQIASDIISFARIKPEFWGYYADYDWVALCQLYGPMVNLPKGWPMYCRDLKQLLDDRGNPKMPKPLKEHNALSDAQWNWWVYQKLMTKLPDSGAGEEGK